MKKFESVKELRDFCFNIKDQLPQTLIAADNPECDNPLAFIFFADNLSHEEFFEVLRFFKQAYDSICEAGEIRGDNLVN